MGLVGRTNEPGLTPAAAWSRYEGDPGARVVDARETLRTSPNAADEMLVSVASDESFVLSFGPSYALSASSVVLCSFSLKR